MEHRFQWVGAAAGLLAGAALVFGFAVSKDTVASRGETTTTAPSARAAGAFLDHPVILDRPVTHASRDERRQRQAGHGEIVSDATGARLDAVIALASNPAVEALADIGGAQAARALSIALNDADTALRAQAVDALADMGGDTAIELLRSAAHDEHRAVREAAEEYLAELVR